MKTKDELLKEATRMITTKPDLPVSADADLIGSLLYGLLCVQVAEAQQRSEAPVDTHGRPMLKVDLAAAQKSETSLSDNEEEAIRWAITQAMDAAMRYENTLLTARAKTLQGLLTRLRGG